MSCCLMIISSFPVTSSPSKSHHYSDIILSQSSTIMACAYFPFQSGRLRMPAPCDVPTKFSAAPSVVCMTPKSKPKSKGLGTKTQGTPGKVVEEPHHGYTDVDTTKISRDFNTHDQTLENHQQQLSLLLPPLVASLAIDGISPYREIAADVVAAAIERMTTIAARAWPTSTATRTMFLEYCRLGLSLSQFYFPEAAQLERIVPLSVMYGVMFLIDDSFDSPWKESLAEAFALDVELPWEFLRALDELLRGEQAPPASCSPLQTVLWDVGQEMKRMSTPGFHAFFVEALLEHHRVVLASHADFAGARSYLLELEAYTAMRVGNSGGVFTVICVEFAYGEFLPDELRVHPLTKRLTRDAIAHALFVNDIFPYSKEVYEGENPCNVITMLMESGGMSFPQAAWRAIEIANSYHDAVMDLDRRLRISEPVPGMRKPLLGFLSRLRDLYSGNVYWSSLVERYRVAEAVFPELRGCYPHHALQQI